MKLNLTTSDRNTVRVTFSVNKFIATFGEYDALLGAYTSKRDLKREFKENGITNAKFDVSAQRMYLNNYGN
jgi:hypothetical protein